MSKPNQTPANPHQGKGAPNPGPPSVPVPSPPAVGQIKIRRHGQWVLVAPKGKKQKGMFTYVEFTDEDGLDTWWVVPPQ